MNGCGLNTRASSTPAPSAKSGLMKQKGGLDVRYPAHLGLDL